MLLWVLWLSFAFASLFPLVPYTVSYAGGGAWVSSAGPSAPIFAATAEAAVLKGNERKTAMTYGVWGGGSWEITFREHTRKRWDPGEKMSTQDTEQILKEINA